MPGPHSVTKISLLFGVLDVDSIENFLWGSRSADEGLSFSNFGTAQSVLGRFKKKAGENKFHLINQISDGLVSSNQSCKGTQTRSSNRMSAASVTFPG